MIEFQHLDNLEIAPENLLPAGLPEIIGASTDLVPTLFYFAKGLQDELDLRRAQFGGQPSLLKAFSTREALQRELRDALDGLEVLTDREITLGPRTSLADRSLADFLSLPSPRREDPKSNEVNVSVGIIDAGFAFWNRKLAPAFQSITAMTVLEKDVLIVDKLDDDKMSSIKEKAKTPGAETEFIRELADEFPSSVFASSSASAPLFGRDRLSHGTAMADLVLQTYPNAKIHGYELPDAVLRDLTGGLLRGVLDVAVRGLADRIIDINDGDERRQKIVILVAFGILGAPESKEPEGLQKLLAATIEDFNARLGVDIELVFPVGNHRQDQCHAVLAPNREVNWRLLPNDHSANTLEITHNDGDALNLVAPTGDAGRLALGIGREEGFDHRNAIWQLRMEDRVIGAVWTRRRSDDSFVTRLTLAPTAPASAPGVPAPFGAWKVSVGSRDDVSIWVLRDETGFEQDPRTPFRPSYLEDAGYRRRDKTSLPALFDPDDGSTSVRRAGTASLLADNDLSTIHAVGTIWGPGDGQDVPYAGLLANPEAVIEKVRFSVGTTDASPGPFGEKKVLGNGGPQTFRSAGTSLSAALYAGIRAAQLDTAPAKM